MFPSPSTGSSSADRALVLGGAGCVFDDVKRLSLVANGFAFHIIACNDVGALWPGPVQTWVTLHKDKMPSWTRLRAKHGYPPAERIVFHEAGVGKDALGHVAPNLIVPHMWQGMKNSGSSGLFAIKVAIDAGHAKVVLCGVPMTKEGGHIVRNNDWKEADHYFAAWPAMSARLQERVRSMSGRTKDLFGEPTREWLAS